MLKKNDIENFRNKIADGESLAVLKELKTHLSGSDLHDEIIILSNKINLYHKNRRIGLITFEELMLAESALSFAILEILKLIEQKEASIELNNNTTVDIDLSKDVIGLNRITKHTEGEAASNEASLVNRLSNINILILGDYNVGKSTLINNVFGQQVSSVGVVPTTLGIDIYELNTNINNADYNLKFIDTPGFSGGYFDGQTDAKVENILLNVLESHIQSVNIFVYVVDASIGIFLKDIDFMRRLTNHFGKDMWSKSIFVLSKNDIIHHEGIINWYKIINYHINKIKESLIDLSNCQDIIAIQFVPMFHENSKNDISWPELFGDAIRELIKKNEK